MGGKRDERIFFPNLDGLRFLAFLSVFLYHSLATDDSELKQTVLYRGAEALFRQGHLGVNLFFVLSGFLITYLLMAERKSTGRIHIGHFYLRRGLRIWPLFYLVVFFGFVVFPILKQSLGQVPDETARLGYYLAFINNFDFIQNGTDASTLGVLWSIAVEEQFYLAWPLILWVTPTRRYPLVFSAIVVASVWFRTLHYQDRDVLDYHTLSIISDMAVGGWGAYAVWRSDRVIEALRGARKQWIVLAYVIGFLGLCIRPWMLDLPTYVIMDRLACSAMFLFIIVEQNEARNSVWKLGGAKRLSRLGRYSYGLYCWHFVGILITLQLSQAIGPNSYAWQVVGLETAVALTITIALALASYHGYEKPFLRFKSKFQKVQSYPQ